ncbi:MAG: AAA family ATPase, partial [Lentisphaerae bacterium]|nr:AAA family ATPase [Lentisphaerota bacterium]
ADNSLDCIRGFNYKPREIRDYLDRFVIQQAEAKKVLAVAICDHYNHARQCIETPALAEKDYAKQNIILLGPTGVGKTYLMRCIARLIGVPFVKSDATKFSETGYVGHDVEDLVRDLVKAADGDVNLAQYGIIYIDEIDKIAGSSGGSARDVSGRGVQVNLLKLMEDTDVSMQSQTDLLGQVEAIMQLQRSGKSPKRTINTRHILFIVSGAFDQLSEVVRHRLHAGAIGFSAETQDEHNDSEFLKAALTRDFIKNGFEPEFIGRLPVRVVCGHLTAHDLEQIMLTAEDSILSQYRRDFAGYGIDFRLTPEALSAVASRAYEERTGARGLMTVMERIFRGFKFELPSTSIKSLEADTRTIEDPEGELRSILRDNLHAQADMLKRETAEFAARFRGEHGFELTFSEEALDKLVEQCIRTDRTIRSIFDEKFRDFHHGLKLIANNTGRKVFTITPEVLQAPDRELSRWIVESFKSANLSNKNPEPPGLS